MTALAPPPVRVVKGSISTGGRSKPVRWMVLPALLMFAAFGLVPLVGVLVLSFTQWDGIGEINPAGFDSWRAVLTEPGLGYRLKVPD